MRNPSQCARLQTAEGMRPRALLVFLLFFSLKRAKALSNRPCDTALFLSAISLHSVVYWKTMRKVISLFFVGGVDFVLVLVVRAEKKEID